MAIAAPQGTYMQQPPQTQLPPQSTGQAPTFYAKQGIGLQPTVAAGYVHFGPQIHYSQYPQTVMNTGPYNPTKTIYPQQYSQQQTQQTPSAQHSPNPQRFSQEMSGYQGQPIIQPIAQNVAHPSAAVSADKPPRGPKPSVPPRVNSKITHESGHRKSISMDAQTGPKSKSDENQIAQDTQQPNQDNPERRYVSTNQVPRTRQDGLYVEANGDVSREQSVISSDVEGSERGIYVSRPERRKSISADTSSSFQRRNDTITFTFPGESSTQAESMLSTNRKPHSNANISDVKPDINTSNFIEQQRRLDMNASMRMSPMPILPTLGVAPKGILVTGERKSVEWSSLSPSQRIVVPQENRRSDYFDDHRRSPMMIDGKRLDEVRRSPMTFVPIRDTNASDRICQKSPNNLPNNFEKTRAELVMWAEQRQRQELESRMMQNREIYTTSPRSRAPSEERRPESRSYGQIDKESRVPMTTSAFQPIANITQNSILEQRRHLRHVSADLTKHMEASRKEFDDQHITGSAVNLGTTGSLTSTTNVISRASPICYQYSAQSEAKLESKVPLTIVTDFNDIPSKPFEQVDHIIHSHRKSQNLSSSNAEKNHDNSQSQPNAANDKIDSQDIHAQQMFHNKQSIDFIAEKLSQCERQQSDLQAKLHCLQSQNEILDKVSQFTYQPSDFQHRMQNLHLQSQIAEKLSQNKSSEFSTASSRDQNSDQEQTNKSILNQCINASRQLYGQPLLTTVSQVQSAGYLTSDARISPRIQQQQQQAQEDSDFSDSIQIPNISQMPLPSLSQFDRADVLSRTPFSQLQRMQQTNDNLDVPCSQPSLASVGTSLNFTGTLKKVPPEKPPRTSLIVQSPDTESNRSQPAIGLKHTSKARPTIFGTVASDLNPKDGNSRRSLPQTPAGKSGTNSGAGIVNGSGTNHPDAAAVNPEHHELVYRDGNLVSGSLEALVQHMVPTEEYYPDRAYLFAFLLSARLFIKPHELLGEVCALCEHQQNLNGEGGKERLHRFVPRLVQLLAEWTETFPYDFRDERVMGHVRSITQKVANVDAAARQEVSVLLQNLLVKLTALERYEEALSRLATDSATEQLSQVDVTELCPSASVLAQQLTHVELERLSYIGPEEFVQAFAKESPHLETSFKDMKKTRNLESYVQWFNRLSYFVATEVCKHPKKKQRVRVVEYWIEAARECFNIGNFNSLMAIIAGLNMSPISRLKKTWSKVQSAKFSILEHHMDPSSNFSSYRSTLKAAMWRSAGATDERQRIVVPFFSLLVKDLYFLNEGCSNKLPNGHINFEKFWQLAKQVTEFIAWKQVTCPFEKNSRVIAFLQASPVLTENALVLASFECEPPDNNHEKERYKALKVELGSQ
ncbi:uncharacterized protein LOC131671574 [Phymastichus coffea]|uniref:uncharacterized protein LOC131671574 n=1 Tax=Phymastichus coffea TaxID=108790 RepID=UPI00273B4B6A|nr:uncharacterized protein LOC131671574 [Phymastichus coffea]